MEEVGSILIKMKTWINNNKWPIISALIGAILGFLYWYFIGCASGNCAITSVWYRTMLYGAIMGWLIGDFANDKFKISKKEDEQL